MDSRIVSMAVLVVCGADEHEQRDILAIEPTLEESEELYLQLFRGLQERGLSTPRLVVSDAHAGLVAAIRKDFPGASWQRCKVHFMRNILAHIPHKDKDNFARILKASGWPPPGNRLADWPKKSAGNTSAVSPKPSATWKTAWRTLCRFMLFHSWTQERFLPPTCWNG